MDKKIAFISLEASVKVLNKKPSPTPLKITNVQYLSKVILGSPPPKPKKQPLVEEIFCIAFPSEESSLRSPKITIIPYSSKGILCLLPNIKN